MEARNAKAARLPLLVQVIRLVRAGDIDDREQWTELAGWLSEKAVAFNRSFGPRIYSLV